MKRRAFIRGIISYRCKNSGGEQKSGMGATASLPPSSELVSVQCSLIRICLVAVLDHQRCSPISKIRSKIWRAVIMRVYNLGKKQVWDKMSSVLTRNDSRKCLKFTPKHQFVRSRHGGDKE